MTRTEQECAQVRELLVDYADGDLEAARAAHVAEHLDRCERCRRLLSDLRRSLELATGIWQQAARRVPEGDWLPQARKRPTVGRRLVIGGLVAAACVVIAVGAGVWLHRPPAKPAPAPSVTLTQAEDAIQRAETSARLLACADILAAQPGCGQQAQDLYDYVSRTYGNARAARRGMRTSRPTDQGVNQ